MKAVWLHLLVGLAGVAAVVWAVFLSANPTITCREVVLMPGQSCPNAQGTKWQTYEERAAAVQGARPVVGTVGVAIAGFAGVLLWQRRTTSVTPGS
ncbi:MAG: hypothetical protein WAS07_03425 [Micropruina sp.]|nr:hypothetical protein [Micropruina sp.]